MKYASQLQDAVEADLNAATLSFAAGTAVASLIPIVDLRDTSVAERLLVGFGDRVDSLDNGTRSVSEKTQDIHIGFMTKLSSKSPPKTEFQPLIDFVDTELPLFFRDKSYTLPSGLKANATDVEYPVGLFTQDDVKERTQFSTILIFSFVAY